jgi:hypothetical protein
MFRIGAVLRVGCLGEGVEIFGPGGTETSETVVARTPPMGWDSWDAFGESVKESDIRATADWMAKNLESYGWRYVVVDAGWYVKNHAAGYNAEAAEFSLDMWRCSIARTRPRRCATAGSKWALRSRHLCCGTSGNIKNWDARIGWRFAWRHTHRHCTKSCRPKRTETNPRARIAPGQTL